MRLIIRLHKPWPSRNVLDKLHWRARHALRKDLEDEIAGEVFISSLFKMWKQCGSPYFRRVDLYRVGQIKDRDNLIGGAKAILDSLGPKGIGLIEDDSDDKVEVTYYQGGKHDRTIAQAVNFGASFKTMYPTPSGSFIVLSEPDLKEG